MISSLKYNKTLFERGPEKGEEGLRALSMGEKRRENSSRARYTKSRHRKVKNIKENHYKVDTNQENYGGDKEVICQSDLGQTCHKTSAR